MIGISSRERKKKQVVKESDPCDRASVTGEIIQKTSQPVTALP